MSITGHTLWKGVDICFPRFPPFLVYLTIGDLTEREPLSPLREPLFPLSVHRIWGMFSFPVAIRLCILHTMIL